MFVTHILSVVVEVYDLATYSAKQLDLISRRVKKEYAKGLLTRERMDELLMKIGTLKKELSLNGK